MNAFEWSSPASVEEAVKLLAEVTADDPYELARPMAGGQDLLTAMKEHIQRPKRVVNLKTIGGLDGLKIDGANLRIGALVTLAEIESHPDVLRLCPGLAQAANSIASVQLRNQGTLGGNLCQRPRCWYFRLEEVVCLKKGGDTCYAEKGENKYHAIFGGGPSFIVHPSDTATMLTALDATLSIAGPSGQRDVPIEKFFHLPADDASTENILKPGEIVTEIAVPITPMAARSAYIKFKERNSIDFAMAAAAAAIEVSPDGAVKQARLVLGGVAPMPWRVPDAEKQLVGARCDAATIAAVAETALKGATPLAKNAYKIPLAKALMRRAIANAASA